MYEYMLLNQYITKATEEPISEMEKEVLIDSYIELIESMGFVTSGSVDLVTEEELLDELREEE